MRFELASVGQSFQCKWDNANKRQIMVRESMEWADAYSLASKNLENLLGLRANNEDLVVYSGGHAFELSSKVVAVVSPQLGFVDIFDS